MLFKVVTLINSGEPSLQYNFFSRKFNNEHKFIVKGIKIPMFIYLYTF